MRRTDNQCVCSNIERRSDIVITRLGNVARIIDTGLERQCGGWSDTGDGQQTLADTIFTRQCCGLLSSLR